jgi:hypothetical protein
MERSEEYKAMTRRMVLNKARRVAPAAAPAWASGGRVDRLLAKARAREEARSAVPVEKVPAGRKRRRHHGTKHVFRRSTHCAVELRLQEPEELEPVEEREEGLECPGYLNGYRAEDPETERRICFANEGAAHREDGREPLFFEEQW